MRESFVHIFGNGVHHSVPTRFHVAVERVLERLQRFILWIGDAMPLYDLFDAALGFLNGVNCRMPFKDVACFTAALLGIYNEGIIQ